MEKQGVLSPIPSGPYKNHPLLTWEELQLINADLHNLCDNKSCSLCRQKRHSDLRKKAEILREKRITRVPCSLRLAAACVSGTNLDAGAEVGYSLTTAQQKKASLADPSRKAWLYLEGLYDMSCSSSSVEKKPKKPTIKATQSFIDLSGFQTARELLATQPTGNPVEVPQSKPSTTAKKRKREQKVLGNAENHPVEVVNEPISLRSGMRLKKAKGIVPSTTSSH